jgi:hypothetical protein
MESTRAYLDKLTSEIKKPEAEIITMALYAGLQHLWREVTLKRYLQNQIPRSEAIEIVGIDWVELAERQSKAMREDLEWALKP